MVTSRILFTAKQKDELWERWKNGQSVLAISRALERRAKKAMVLFLFFVQVGLAISIGVPSKPNSSRSRRSMNRR